MLNWLPIFFPISILERILGLRISSHSIFVTKILAFGKVGTSTSLPTALTPRDQNVNASLTLHQYLLSLILTLVSYQLTKILLLHQSFVAAI